jgi:hypothetical protein
VKIEGNEAVTSEVFVFDDSFLKLGLGIDECCLGKLSAFSSTPDGYLMRKPTLK